MFSYPATPTSSIGALFLLFVQASVRDELGVRQGWQYITTRSVHKLQNQPNHTVARAQLKVWGYGSFWALKVCVKQNTNFTSTAASKEKKSPL